MKRYLFLLFVAAMSVPALFAAVDIDGTTYQVDTLIHRQIGPGVMNTVVRLPQYPLNVYVLETDLNNPYNRVETTIANNTVGGTELLTKAYVRNRTATKRPFAACNANFWVVGGSGAPWNVYALGTPMGAVVRNDTTYVNTNTTADQWDGGPTRTGATAITHDKTVYNGRFMWYGKVKGDKLNGELDFSNVNRRCLNNDLALWNAAYSRTRAFEDDWVGHNERGDNQTDNYYLNFAQGENWAVSKDMRFVVAAIVKGADRQKLGDYDACLTATGNKKAALESLEVGDEIFISSSWMVNDPDREKVFIDVENMVEGNAYIMHNGELTGRNYDETYNSQVYSRTCYGSSADGKHLYMIVIDKATSNLYGASAGCPTAVACQILKGLCPDVTEIVNYDAGGSAEMMVHGAIINTTTEGTPRAVACGWMLEAVGEEDNVVASIAFADYKVKMPVYSSHRPRILGYNARGELVDTDVQGVTLSADPGLGVGEGPVFTAGGDAGTGVLEARLGDMTATVPVVLLAAQPAIMHKPVIVIDDRSYPVDVTATVDNVTYSYDPSKLTWSVDDPTVASIDGGVLRGLKNGAARITCQIGTFTDEDSVHVEISDVPYRLEPLTEWTFHGSGVKNISLDASTGVVSFTLGSGRSPYLSLLKELTLFGLPDRIGVDFSCTLEVPSVVFDVRNASHSPFNYQTVEVPNGSDVNAVHSACVDLDQLGGASHVPTYPITLGEIEFDLKKSSEKENTLTIHRIYAHYPVAETMLTGDVNADGELSVADVTALVALVVAHESTERSDVNADGETSVADVTTLVQLLMM